MSLKTATAAELKAELKRREEEGENHPPKPLKKPDFSALIVAVTSGVESLAKERREQKDWDHFVFEKAVEAIYGKDYWKWHNSII